MNQSRFAAVILAAGNGTRMKSAIPKVMHPIAGRPMIAYLLKALQPLSPAATVVVVGPQMDAVAQSVAPAQSVVQDPPRGTGDAVRAALTRLEGHLAPQGGLEEVLVLYGDTPFLATETLSRLLEESRSRPPVSAPAPRPITSPISATARSGRGPISAPARSPAIMTAQTSSAR